MADSIRFRRSAPEISEIRSRLLRLVAPPAKRTRAAGIPSQDATTASASAVAFPRSGGALTATRNTPSRYPVTPGVRAFGVTWIASTASAVPPFIA